MKLGKRSEQEGMKLRQLHEKNMKIMNIMKKKLNNMESLSVRLFQKKMGILTS